MPMVTKVHNKSTWHSDRRKHRQRAARDYRVLRKIVGSWKLAMPIIEKRHGIKKSAICKGLQETRNTPR